MSNRVARLALWLYPLAFRRRYGAEMQALLDQKPPRARDAFDLLRGALGAHLRPSAALGSVDGGDRVRASAAGVLGCWVLFAAAGFGFYKTTEDHEFAAAGNGHPLLGGAHVAVQALAVVASATLVLGALPLIAAALAQARRQPGLWRVVLRPLGPVVLFAVLTALLVAVAHAHPSAHPTGASRGAFIIWALAGLGCGAACVIACRAAVFAVALDRGRLLAAMASGTLVTVAMTAMTLAVAVYAIALAVDASSLAGQATGPFGLLSTGGSLVAQVVLMGLAGALAATATVRGWRGAGQLAGAE